MIQNKQAGIGPWGSLNQLIGKCALECKISALHLNIYLLRNVWHVVAESLNVYMVQKFFKSKWKVVIGRLADHWHGLSQLNGFRSTICLLSEGKGGKYYSHYTLNLHFGLIHQGMITFILWTSLEWVLIPGSHFKLLKLGTAKGWF